GAFMAKEKASVFTPGEHGSTFGGNALTCAASYAALKFIIDNNIAGNVLKVGEYLMEGLKNLQRKFPFITNVRGRGLLQAIEFDSDIGQDALTACLHQGLLINCVKPNALRLMPPLVIGNDEVDRALDILDKVLSGLTD
ncbi:MAG: aminotransferase class III-fold pyridoxal phosphate-dependent enzyme, partial [Dehalococcoidales bacterium]